MLWEEDLPVPFLLLLMLRIDMLIFWAFFVFFWILYYSVFLNLPVSLLNTILHTWYWSPDPGSHVPHHRAASTHGPAPCKLSFWCSFTRCVQKAATFSFHLTHTAQPNLPSLPLSELLINSRCSTSSLVLLHFMYSSQLSPLLNIKVIFASDNSPNWNLACCLVDLSTFHLF